jgi:long-chain fatty acid transport protein
MSSGAASSSSFALLEQSASRLGTAFAGTGAAADDATTVFYNPAGMTALDASEATLVLSTIYIDSSFDNEASQPALGQPLGGEGGNAGGWNAVPSVYVTLPFSDTLAAGLAVNVPFGLSLDYERDWMGRFQALRSEIQTYNFNPAIAWEINEHVSVGLGLNYQRVQAELTNAVNYSAVVAQGLQQLVAAGQLSPALVPALLAANAGLEGATRLRGDDSAWGYNAGVTVTLPGDVRIGLSYRSSMEYEIEGSVRFDEPAATNPIGGSIIASASAGVLADGAAAVDLELPDSATLSWRVPLSEEITLLADVAWTGWSSIQELRAERATGEVISITPENWEDTWRFALGATFAVDQTLTLRAGIALDETPVPAETRTARLPDTDRTWIAVGARWQASDALVIDAGYAHLFGDEVRVEQNAGSTALNALLVGEQKTAVDIVSVQAAYRF